MLDTGEIKEGFERPKTESTSPTPTGFPLPDQVEDKLRGNDMNGPVSPF